MKKHTITTYDFYSFRHNIFASGVNYMGGARQVFVRKVFVLKEFKTNSFICLVGFLGGLDGKESTRNVGDLDLIPGWARPLGGGTGTHSSIPAWRIPWTGEPGRLQSMGLQRVRHD